MSAASTTDFYSSPPDSLRERLRTRAEALGVVRCFFSQRGIIEVDCPALSPYPGPDPQIAQCTVDSSGHHLSQTLESRKSPSQFLHSSPEIGMKKLLCRGSGPIYQLSHVYRAGEIGRLHRIEFTMLEWYQLGENLRALQDETCALIEVLLGKRKRQRLSFRELYQRYAGIDPNDVSLEKLQRMLPNAPEGLELEALLDLLLTSTIERKLEKDTLHIIEGFPPERAAMSQVRDGLAQRFEIYLGSIELANGYLELCDAQEHNKRFAHIDPEFLRLLQTNPLPPCCGVALGFDRLLMLAMGKDSLDGVNEG